MASGQTDVLKITKVENNLPTLFFPFFILVLVLDIYSFCLFVFQVAVYFVTHTHIYDIYKKILVTLGEELDWYFFLPLFEEVIRK